MYFSEVDVDVRQPRSRDPIASLKYVLKGVSHTTQIYGVSEKAQSIHVLKKWQMQI